MLLSRLAENDIANGASGSPETTGTRRVGLMAYPPIVFLRCLQHRLVGLEVCTVQAAGCDAPPILITVGRHFGLSVTVYAYA